MIFASCPYVCIYIYIYIYVYIYIYIHTHTHTQIYTIYCVGNHLNCLCPMWWSPCQTYVAPSVQRRKLWLTSTTRCRAVTLPRRKTRWNLQGCPKHANRSQPKFTILLRHVEDISLLNKYFYSAPQCSHCKRCISYSNSVCPSVCPSHAGIVSKRRHAARCSLHCLIAKCV